MSGVFDTAALIHFASHTAFRGADASRLYADRWRQTNDPDTEIRYSVRPLRAAARDLVRNNPYATGAVEAIADNIIGWQGIRPRPRILLSNGDSDRKSVNEIKRGWEEWGDEFAMVDEVESWFETERLIAKSWFTDGEVLIRHRLAWDNPYGYAIELIDPDLLDESFNESRAQNGREIVMGVEIDEHGRRIAYHFWKHHPDNMGFNERVRIEAAEITHYFIRYRANQTRGFSGFAPILTTVEMVDGYTEAELVAARQGASKMGMITNNEPDAVAAYAARLSIGNNSGKGDVVNRTKVSPGSIDELAPGQGFESYDPNHPNDAFDPFLKALMRGMARGVHMSYQTFSGDVSDASYSNTRSGMIPERDHWKVLQNVYARRVSRPVYRNWLRMGMLTGGLELAGVSPAPYRSVAWRARRWQWVDPVKDLTALEAEIKLGINTRQRAAAERGNDDFEVLIDESAEDMEYAREKGVYVGGLNGPTARAAPSAAPPANTNGAGTPTSRLQPLGV